MIALKSPKPHKCSPLKRAPLRVPGQSLEEEIDRVLNERVLFLFLFGLVMLLLGIYQIWEYFDPAEIHPLATAIVVLPCLAVSWTLGWRQLKRVRSLRQGRDGERIVAEALNALRQRGFVAIHDLVDREGNFNIDHVLVGPTGVFVIETKTWSKPPGIAKIDHIDIDTIRVPGTIPDRDPLTRLSLFARR